MFVLYICTRVNNVHVLTFVFDSKNDRFFRHFFRLFLEFVLKRCFFVLKLLSD